jgi:hypothetical protein
MGLRLMTLILTVAPLVACTSQPTAVIVAPTAVIVDDADAISWEAGFLWIAAAPIDPTAAINVNATAAAAARSITGGFSPSGCATASADENALSLRLDGCSGPFGLSHVSGTVTLTFTTAPGGTRLPKVLRIQARTSELKTSGGSLSINATGILTASDDGRTLSVATNGGGTGPRGFAAARKGQYIITWISGATCALVYGTVATGDGSVQSVAFRGFSVCTRGCPPSGMVTVTDPTTGTVLSTTYNGTATVTILSSDGQASNATLSCS